MYVKVFPLLLIWGGGRHQCLGFSPSTVYSSRSVSVVRSTRSSDSSSVVEPRQFVELTNPLDGMILDDDDISATQPGFMDKGGVALSSVGSKLPASFIRSWPAWVLETDGSWKRIPDAASTLSTDNESVEESSGLLPTGHVDPLSIDELWSPIDLKRPQMRLVLGAHVRQGMIRHIMPAVDIGYFDPNQEDIHHPSLIYRNRGMCSVPIAHTWMEFLGKYGRFKLVASVKGTKNGKENSQQEEWTEILQSSSTGKDVADAIDRATVALAAEDVPAELGDGSHLVQIVLSGDVANDFVEIPKSGHELRVSMVAINKNNDDADFFGSDVIESTTVTTQKMIETPEDRERRRRRQEVARLQVQILSIMAGRESQYLPHVYKKLFNDPSFRNPLYDQYMSKKEEQG